VKHRSRKALIHGNFEILHTGHVRLFFYAKEVASELVVALCIQGLDDVEIERRLSSLRAIPVIDDLITFNNIDEMITETKPNVIIKGREFASIENIEEKLISKHGGTVIFSSGGDDLLQTNVLPTLLSHSGKLTNPILNYLNRNKIDLDQLKETINRFPKTKILVVGDVILDEFIECAPTGVSQESSTLVARPLWSKQFLGGAGIVAAHCSSLGAEASLLTILGSDKESESIREFCREFKVKLHEIHDFNHPTVLKQRFKTRQQTLFRLNRFSQEGISKSIRSALYDEFRGIVGKFDAVIFADFSYGLFDTEDVQDLVKYAKGEGVFISADSQSSSQIGNLARFIGANLICPTEREARMEIRDKDGLIVLSQKLMARMDSEFIFLKLGSDGLLINGTGIKTDHIAALNENPLDVSGAGDSLLAISTLAFAAKDKPSVAALLGSLAAAIQVSRSGNIPITNYELIDLINKLD